MKDKGHIFCGIAKVEDKEHFWGIGHGVKMWANRDESKKYGVQSTIIPIFYPSP